MLNVDAGSILEYGWLIIHNGFTNLTQLASGLYTNVFVECRQGRTCREDWQVRLPSANQKTVSENVTTNVVIVIWQLKCDLLLLR